MEENKTTKKETKLSYEELEKIALQLQQRTIQAESNLRAINVAAIRLEYLFKVLDKETFFPSKFIAKCADEIVSLLESGEEPNKEEDKQ